MTEEFKQEQLTEILETVSKNLQKETNVYLFGGAVMVHNNLKPSTKDIDLLFDSKTEYNHFVTACKKTGFILRLNYHLLSRQYTTIMLKLNSISKERKQAFFDYLYEDERFYTLMQQIGAWDLSLMMFFENPKDQRGFLIKIKEKFSDLIASYDSAIHFDQYYYTSLANGIVKELTKNS